MLMCNVPSPLSSWLILHLDGGIASCDDGIGHSCTGVVSRNEMCELACTDNLSDWPCAITFGFAAIR